MTALGAWALLPWLALSGDGAGEERTNLVLFVSDDQGYGDFSHAGHGALETPHLDRLAAESPRVERFYVSPVCSPTRASLMTGRWNYRTRVVDTWIGRSMMEPDEVTLAELLREAGFATGIFGKWHLGDCHPMRPLDQGFERALVHRGGGLAQPSEPPENGRRYTNPVLFRDGEPVETEGYCTDVYVDAALQFIDSSLDEGRPFFAYVATNAPHDPFHDVPPGPYARYAAMDLAPTLRGKSEEVDREARICAMIENIDANVGRLLAHLEARGIAGQTVFCFLNDNGPLWGRFTRGLRGHKAQPYEGGIRSPLFVRWPGVLSPETTVLPPTAHVDLLPTFLELLGVERQGGPNPDGRSLAPLLRGEGAAWPDRHLVLQSHRGNVPAREHHFAVIGPRWKLVRASGFGRHAPEPESPFELFDLTSDPGELDDLADRHPEVVRSLRAVYGAWYDDVSTTRQDNWDPPRIRIGTAAEPRTTLTKQDRRHREGEGWDGDRDGSWWLAAPRELEVELTLLFLEEVRVDRVRVDVGDGPLELEVRATGTRLRAGSFRCPAGPFELAVEIEADGELRPLHQVVLEAHPPR